MGTQYFIACKRCRVVRDLDKLRPEKPATRAEALAYAGRISSYRSALLVGFLAEHEGHDCVFFSEHHSMFAEAFCQDDPETPSELRKNYATDDKDFWTRLGTDSTAAPSPPQTPPSEPSE